MSNKIYLKDVVYGGTIESIIYAHLNDFFFIPDGDYCPFYLEFLDSAASKLLGIEEILTLNTLNGPREMGALSLELWSQLLYRMSMLGKCLITNDIQTIRLEDNSIRITHKRPYYIDIHFEKLFVFSEYNLDGLSAPVEKLENTIRTYDWLDLREGLSSDVDYMKVDKGPIREVFLYPSERWDGFSNKRKDICIISELPEKEVNLFENSDTYFRLILENIINESGIRSQYRKVKLENKTREVKIISRPRYENRENIIFKNNNIKEILQECEDARNKFSGDNSRSWPSFRF